MVTLSSSLLWKLSSAPFKSDTTSSRVTPSEPSIWLTTWDVRRGTGRSRWFTLIHEHEAQLTAAAFVNDFVDFS